MRLSGSLKPVTSPVMEMWERMQPAPRRRSPESARACANSISLA
jgi:hypothetical protein